MAVFKRLTREEILKDYTHYGLMYGVVPIYVGDPNGESRVCVRNWWPDWLLDFADGVFFICSSIYLHIDDEYEPNFFYKLTAEIHDENECACCKPEPFADRYCPTCLGPVCPKTGNHWESCEYEASTGKWINPVQPLTERQMLKVKLDQSEGALIELTQQAKREQAKIAQLKSSLKKI